MAPAIRPTGTDGSDHEYREKVAGMYKGMPVWRAAGWMLLHLSSIPIVLKLGWSLTPIMTMGQAPNPLSVGIVMAVLYLIALLSWTLARPASYKESLALIQISNSIILVILAMHICLGFKYHLQTLPAEKHSHNIWVYLQYKQGWQGEHWFVILQYLEWGTDMLALGFLAPTAYCIHNYIIRKMNVNKKLAGLKKEEPDINTTPVPAGARRRRA